MDTTERDRPAYIGLRHGAKRKGGLNVEVETTPEDNHEIILKLSEAMTFLRTLDWTDKEALKCVMNVAYCRGWLRTHFRHDREKEERYRCSIGMESK